MSAETDKEISDQLGKILAELGNMGTNQSNLHVKMDQLHTAVKRIGDDRMRDRFDIDRAHRRLGALESQVAVISQNAAIPDWRPDPREITGTHDFAVIKRQHEDMVERQKRDDERRFESAIWWKRKRWTIAFAIVGALSVTALGSCAGYVTSHVTIPIHP